MAGIEICSENRKRRRKYLNKQKAFSQSYRDVKKQKFEQDVAHYKMLNDMHKVFPPQQWTSNQFKQFDEPLKGERKDKNRIASANSRRRAQLMHEELQSRIDLLSNCNQPTYEPPFYFPLPAEELVLPPLFPELPPVVHSEIKIRGETATFGRWIL
jgi:hypothetical protein